MVQGHSTQLGLFYHFQWVFNTSLEEYEMLPVVSENILCSGLLDSENTDNGNGCNKRKPPRQLFYVIICDHWKLNPSGAETGIFHENYIATMTADAMDPIIAKASAAMILNIHGSWSSIPFNKSNSRFVFRRKHQYDTLIQFALFFADV